MDRITYKTSNLLESARRLANYRIALSAYPSHPTSYFHKFVVLKVKAVFPLWVYEKSIFHRYISYLEQRKSEK